jgi:RimJ/RimL family protein N-acetyltransferase
MLLDEAFNKMNLKTVTGECYKCNPGLDFWYRVIEKYNGHKTILPNRKFWNGKYYDSLYFSIDCAEFRA